MEYKILYTVEGRPSSTTFKFKPNEMPLHLTTKLENNGGCKFTGSTFDGNGLRRTMIGYSLANLMVEQEIESMGDMIVALEAYFNQSAETKERVL